MQQNACTSKLCDTSLSLPITLSLLAVEWFCVCTIVDVSFYGVRVGIVLDRPQSTLRTHSLQLDKGVVLVHKVTVSVLSSKRNLGQL